MQKMYENYLEFTGILEILSLYKIHKKIRDKNTHINPLLRS